MSWMTRKPLKTIFTTTVMVGLTIELMTGCQTTTSNGQTMNGQTMDRKTIVVMERTMDRLDQHMVNNDFIGKMEMLSGVSGMSGLSEMSVMSLIQSANTMQSPSTP